MSTARINSRSEQAFRAATKANELIGEIREKQTAAWDTYFSASEVAAALSEAQAADAAYNQADQAISVTLDDLCTQAEKRFLSLGDRSENMLMLVDFSDPNLDLADLREATRIYDNAADEVMVLLTDIRTDLSSHCL
jgi:hypothetical protein